MATRKTKRVFRDPFAVEPLPKAHYHPTPERALNKQQKTIAVNLKCSLDLEDTPCETDGKISPVDELFLKGTNSYRTRPFDWHLPEDDGNFDESWPASERPSSISLTGLEDESQIDLENYQSIVERFTTAKHTGPETCQDQQKRVPGIATQASGSAFFSSKSKVPVKNTKLGRKETTSSLKAEKQRTSGKDMDAEGSVLQKYIERFRNSAPMSREERLKKTDSESKDFWWLSDTVANVSNSFTKEEAEPPPGSAIPKQSHHSGASQLTKANVEKYKHFQELSEKRGRKNIPESPGDRKTLELQRKAEELLEKSVSSVATTEPAVSTEGLGSNVSDMSSLEEYTYKPKFAQYLDSEIPARQGLPPPMPGQRPLPDNDPLQQWRLRRRMEQAQQSAPAVVQDFNFLSKTDQQKRIDARLDEFKQKLSGRSVSKSTHSPRQMQFTPAPHTPNVAENLHVDVHGDFSSTKPPIASPTLRPCKPQTDPSRDVDPHLHLMCDLLPCPHRGHYQQYMGEQMDSADTKTLEKSKGDNFDICSKQGGNKEKSGDEHYKQYLEAEKPDIECIMTKENGKKNSVVSEEETDHIHRDLEKIVQDIVINREMETYKNESGNSENVMIDTDKHYKQCQDGSQDNNLSNFSVQKPKQSDVNIMTSSKKGASEGKNLIRQNEEVRQENVMKPKHSSSPNLERKGINAAVGQVIKEHLFSTSTSTVLSSVESLPPSASTEKPSLPGRKTSTKPPSDKQTTSTVSAEELSCESDGEFPEDEMLIMLRKQRAEFEQQLHEIDRLLGDMDR